MSHRSMLVALFALALSSCTPFEPIPDPPEGALAPDTRETSVTFRERVIDLEPFLVGFPYSRVDVDLEHGHVFYFEKTDHGTWLRHLPYAEDGLLDLTQGRRVNDIDWSTRSWWGGEFHPPSGKLYITSDEANDEHMNVYAIDVASGAVEPVTENDYTYAWDFSDDGRQLAYLARHGETEPFNTCLVVRQLETGEERQVFCDGGGVDRFTWSSLRFLPDHRSIVLGIQHDSQRNTTTLAKIDLDGEAKLDFIIPPRVVRRGLSQIEGWVRPGVMIYQSSESGFGDLYRLDLSDRSVARLTAFDDDVNSVDLLETTPPTVLVTLGRPHESELQLLDANTGAVLTSEVIPANVSVNDAHGNTAILSVRSLTSSFGLVRMKIARDGEEWSFVMQDLAGLPEDLHNEIVHVVPEKVSFPTFDTIEDGSERMLHAFYLEPKSPPTHPLDRRVLITAFYGGSNSYRTETNILAAAGIATMSPSVRGCGGFGAEFAGLNDGDLGGDEIVDVMAAARWLVEEKGYEPHQIGVHGGSHGGYATLRCLTFPPETNGRNESFDFGFGWSHAGFSDIESFYASCNIPDWVIKEAGDPATESQKLRDRSPISHVHRLRAPVLLTHGANDWRVPVEESRKFVRKARELGKPVVYEEFPGQGHHIRGFQNQVRYYQKVLEFFESQDRFEGP